MAYGGDPANSPTDAVRFWAQDIGDPPLISDQEIAYLIGLYTPANGADPLFIAAKIADQIVFKYADEIDITADGVSYSGSQLGARWEKIAATLRASYNELRGMGAQVYVAGVKIGDCPAWGTRPSNFRVAMFDNTRAGAQPSGEFFDEGLVGPEYGEPW